MVTIGDDGDDVLDTPKFIVTIVTTVTRGEQTVLPNDAKRLDFCAELLRAKL